jgi:hypothetical protein
LTDAAEVSGQLDLSDENVQPLYDDLEFHFSRLQKLLNKMKCHQVSGIRIFLATPLLRRWVGS